MSKLLKQRSTFIMGMAKYFFTLHWAKMYNAFDRNLTTFYKNTVASRDGVSINNYQNCKCWVTSCGHMTRTLTLALDTHTHHCTHWQPHASPHTRSIFLGISWSVSGSRRPRDQGTNQGGKTLVSFCCTTRERWQESAGVMDGRGRGRRRFGWFTKNERRKFRWAIRKETFSPSITPGWAIRSLIVSLGKTIYEQQIRILRVLSVLSYILTFSTSKL